jgi:hypothetical protein
MRDLVRRAVDSKGPAVTIRGIAGSKEELKSCFFLVLSPWASE